MTHIRPARLADAPAIVELLDALGYPGTAPFIAERIAQMEDHPDAELVVAEFDGEVAGVLSLNFMPQLALAGDFCRVSYLCVDARSRGAGIGALLERHAVERARARGCDRIELHCHARRTDAHRFYARQGYEDSPRYFVKCVE